MNITMSKPYAILSPLFHRGTKHIKVEIANNENCKKRIRQVQGRKWSATHRCWYVPYTSEAFRQLKELFDLEMAGALPQKIKAPKTSSNKTSSNESPPSTGHVRLERESDKRMKAFVPWQRNDWIEQIKTIPGRAWNEQGKYWSLPMVKTTVQHLMEWFGENVQWKFELPADLPETYLPRSWKQSTRKETHIEKKETTASQSRSPNLPPAQTTTAAAKPMVLPAASLNKLNIRPGAAPHLMNYIQNGREMTKVAGETVVISKSGDHFLEAYIPHEKKGWIEEIKTVPGRKWSPETKCWRLPYVVESVKLLYRAFGEKAVFNFRPSDPIPLQWKDKPKPKPQARPLSAAHKECLVALEEQLMLERKSHSTIKGYKSNLRRFLEFYRGTVPAEISERQIKDYLLYLVNEKGISESTQNQVINAIKAFFEKVLKQEKKMYYIPRPKRRQTLPNILSEKEVIDLLNVTDNKKHKGILMVIYSGGLRLGELVNLKIRDIDPDRQRIFIHAGKGKKDRYTLLSKKAMLYLQKYMLEYQPKDWLFEGQDGGQYGKRSVQKIFKKACRKAGIKKPVTVHSLRHSFATHLHEK
ncbi:MAG: hypothetical protein D6714_08150, partial [Bacteroidetes bacterium]